MRTVLRAVAAILCVFTLSTNSIAETLDSTVTARVSIGTYTGAPESDSGSTNVRVSRNGRFVVFQSAATNLVSPSTSGTFQQVYLLDRQAGTVELISQSLSGGEGVGNSGSPAVSDDGRYVTFTSDGAISGYTTVCYSDVCDVNKSYPGTHIFVRDRLANETKLVSQVSLPCKVFDFDDTGALKVEDDPVNTGQKRPVLKVVTKRIAAKVIGGGNAISANPVISADGRFIAYDTDANNLPGVIEKITYPALTGGVDYNPASGALTGAAPDSIFEAITVYTDGNGVRDVYVRDGSDFSNRRVSLGCKLHAPEGCDVEGTSDLIKPGISDDGTYVTFQSITSFLDHDINGVNDIFLVKRSDLNGEVSVLSRVSNDISRIRAANGASTDTSINGDGRFIAFSSAASSLVSGDTNSKIDVFVYDTKFFKIVRCLLADGTQANQDVTFPRIAGNGEFVVMQTAATNWGVTSGISNIYLGTLARATNGALASCKVELASVGIGAGGDASSTLAGVGLVPRTVNGTLSTAPAVVYQSLATNLHSGTADTNAVSDIFEAPTCTSTDLATDTDSDGTSNCFDQCPNDPLKVVDSDSDGDGSPDCADACPSDALKIAAGLCGCGVADTDSDADGTPDCIDLCPNDPAKTAAGQCGCGFVDTDSNNNGTADCKEIATGTPVAGTPTPTPIASATPTPNNSVQSFIPAKPAVSRLSSTRFLVDMSGSGASFAIDKYIVQLFIVQSGRTRYVREKISSSSQVSLKITKVGTYKVKYSVRIAAGKQSKVSPFSAAFKKR